MRRLGVRRSASLALAVFVVLGACGVGDKDAHATRIRASREAVASASPATGQVTLELELDERAVAELESTERQQLEAALAGRQNPTITVQATIDGKSRNAVVSHDPASLAPATIFLDTEMFAKRLNARPTERRTWARLDLADLVDDERPIDTREMTAGQVLLSVASTINPAYLLDLVEGTLTGSVKSAGQEQVGDASTTRYDMNISFEKALDELDFDDEEQAVRMRLFRLLRASGDVVPARVWIDDDGRLRRLEVELKQRITRRRSNELTMRLELGAFGTAAAVEPPAKDVTVTYERFGRLVRSVLPEGE